jgi:hypothetical protein
MKASRTSNKRYVSKKQNVKRKSAINFENVVKTETKKIQSWLKRRLNHFIKDICLDALSLNTIKYPRDKSKLYSGDNNNERKFDSLLVQKYKELKSIDKAIEELAKIASDQLYKVSIGYMEKNTLSEFKRIKNDTKKGFFDFYFIFTESIDMPLFDALDNSDPEYTPISDKFKEEILEPYIQKFENVFSKN